MLFLGIEMIETPERTDLGRAPAYPGRPSLAFQELRAIVMQETGGPLLHPGVRFFNLGCNFPEHCLFESVRQFIPMPHDALSETAENVIGRVSGCGVRYGGARTPFIFPIREHTRTVVLIAAG